MKMTDHQRATVLKAQNEALTEKQMDFTQYVPYHMQVVNSVAIDTDTYQREVEDDKMRDIVAGFNEYIANEPKLSYRNGKYYAFDGQHTIEARKRLNGNKDCDICGAKYSNHTGGTATCSEKAICAICGEKYGDFARHSWSEWKTDADGKRTKECSACGKVANFMYGDFNYDGKVNTIDLTIMRKYLAGYDVEFDTAAADFNGDGKVSTVDLTTLRKYLAGYDVVLDGNSQKMKSIYKAKAFSVGVGELLLRSLFAIGSRH